MFYIIEVQKNSEGSYSHLTYTEETQRLAESKFYTVAAAAALSGLPLHSVMMFQDDGSWYSCKSYETKPEPEPEPEPEEEEPEE